MSEIPFDLPGYAREIPTKGVIKWNRPAFPPAITIWGKYDETKIDDWWLSYLKESQLFDSQLFKLNSEERAKFDILLQDHVKTNKEHIHIFGEEKFSTICIGSRSYGSGSSITLYFGENYFVFIVSFPVPM